MSIEVAGDLGVLTEELPKMETGLRIGRLREGFEAVGIDAIVVTNLTNVRYLTGFTGSAATLLVTAEAALITTDGRYRTQCREELENAGVAAEVDVEIGGLQAQRDALKACLVTKNALGGAHVGLESESVSWGSAKRMIELLDGLNVVATSGLVEELRESKDAGEIARIKRAAGIADAALGEVLPMLATRQRCTGVTEADFALELDTAMRRLGAEGAAFETIVAAGANSAKPHHQPTLREIVRGDAVVVDFGAIYEGYRSDMTRTFSVGGDPGGELARVFDVVETAQAHGVAAVKAGVSTKDVDDACRKVIADAGWGEAFEHGTGHGVGLDIHEDPTVGPLGSKLLATGVVVTVEPGVYLPGIGGVRIEDTLVVTEGGSCSLTRFPKTTVPA
ncbi:MAG: M24 family metallopeptidase [Acidimicrobiales bacterium]